MGTGMARRAVLTTLLLGIGLAACGGDDAPSREDFAKEANRICRETEKELESVGGGSRAEVADAIDKVIKEARQAADDLVDLERPDGEDGERAERFVEGFDGELEELLVPALEDLRDAVEANDPEAAQQAADRLRELEDTESDKFARELGASACVG